MTETLKSPPPSPAVLDSDLTRRRIRYLSLAVVLVFTIGSGASTLVLHKKTAGLEQQVTTLQAQISKAKDNSNLGAAQKDLSSQVADLNAHLEGISEELKQ